MSSTHNPQQIIKINVPHNNMNEQNSYICRSNIAQTYFILELKQLNGKLKRFSYCCLIFWLVCNIVIASVISFIQLLVASPYKCNVLGTAILLLTELMI